MAEKEVVGHSRRFCKRSAVERACKWAGTTGEKGRIRQVNLVFTDA